MGTPGKKIDREKLATILRMRLEAKSTRDIARICDVSRRAMYERFPAWLIDLLREEGPKIFSGRVEK